MPTYRCPGCKRIHSVGGIPEKQLNFLIPDEVVDDVVDRILEVWVEDEEQRKINIGVQIMHGGDEVYHCPDCGTLVITGNDKLAGVYRPLKS